MANADSSDSCVRVLVGDDYEPWRYQVRSILASRPELQIVGEVSDGLHAVKKARDLNPDLMLLDVGLPKMNGVEVAKVTRQLVPCTRIILMTQNTDKFPIRAALSSGAHGYILKGDAGSELLPAIKATLRGEKFVSSGILDDCEVAGTRTQ